MNPSINGECYRKLMVVSTKNWQSSKSSPITNRKHGGQGRLSRCNRNQYDNLIDIHGPAVNPHFMYQAAAFSNPARTENSGA